MITWILAASIVVNMILLIVIAMLVYLHMLAQAEATHARQEWCIWENRFFEAQALVRSKFGSHMSPSGLRTEIGIKDMMSE
jgi:heme/copper-type cytochrome/quinol oxidase subunit 2